MMNARGYVAEAGRFLLRWRWVLGLGAFAVLVFMRAHGVSLDFWDHAVKDTTPDYRYWSIGKDRPIRSDEYVVSLPMVMAQCGHPGFFPRVNERINGTGMDMFVTTPPCPVWDWTVIGQAANWGYFLFGFERGLSWNWWIRYLLLFLFALEFFLIWLRDDAPLAFAGALAVTLGSPTQWWMTTVPYIELFFFASLVFLHKLFSWRSLWAQMSAGIGLLVSLSSFGFSFYPPFQLLYLAIMLPLAFAMVRHERCFSLRRPAPWVALGAVLVALGGVWWYFLATHWETLREIADSAYPGARIFVGGSLRQFFGTQTWKLINLFTPWRNVTFSNACEISVFFAPMIALFVVVAHAWRVLKREMSALLILAVLGLMMLGWTAFRWPEWLARATLLSHIGPHRMVMVASFLFLLMTFKVFSVCEKRGVTVGWLATALALSCSLAALVSSLMSAPQLLGYYLNRRPGLGILMLIVGGTLLVATSFALMRTQRRCFMASYVAVALLSGALVHPFSIGASPLRDKQLAVRIHDVIAEHGDGLWLCNDPYVAQFAGAHGARVLNGVHQAPNPGLWRAIDPDGRYQNAWRRYAHFSARIVPHCDVRAEVKRQTNSQVTWYLDRQAVERLNVKYLLWAGGKVREPWVDYIGRVRLNFIYEVPANETPSSGEGQAGL